MYDFLKDKTVLYIEDEPAVLENISELLSNFFSHFYTALNAEEGYTIFKDKSIDILLVDIELPRMNGISLIKKIRKIDKNLPIVIISAYTKTDYLLESVELHLDKYIVKPLTSRKIHLLLESLNNDFYHENYLYLSDKLFFDKDNIVLYYEGKEIPLTKRESNFLSAVVQNKVITYNEIYLLWDNEIPTDNAIRSFVKYLRRKLPDNILKNRSGVGYYIEIE